MQWADDFRIETPEQIDVSLELAGLGSRFVAQVLDWLIKWGLLVLIGLVVLVVLALAGTAFNDKTVQVYVATFLVALFYLLLLGYDIYFEVRHNGQTPGKKRAGLRVIREGGAPVDFRSACIRNLLAMADFLPAFFLLGGLLVLLTERRQRLGDLAAGTLVIRERALEPPADLSMQIAKVASEEFVFTADQLSACTGDDRHILRSFFQRYHQLESSPRRKLACRLAEEFLQKTGYPLTEPLRGGSEAEAFLASLYRDIEKLAEHGR
jgi:uncharacterized RDD family membrane protein YckC